VLEASSVLNELLRPAGYHRDQIDELAVWYFLDYELANIREPTNIHLLAVKKALLYAAPAIAPPKKHLGFAFTSAVATPAHEDLSPEVLLQALRGYAPAAIDVSRIPGVTAHRGGSCRLGPIYFIGPSYYEKVELFVAIDHAIDHAIANNMYPAILPPQIRLGFARGVARCPPPTWARLQRMSPLAKLEYLSMLNAVLTREVDGTFACALYETLQNTSSWDLYDQIRVYGFDSAQIGEQLRLLAYVKEQTLKARQSTRAAHGRTRREDRANPFPVLLRLHRPSWVVRPLQRIRARQGYAARPREDPDPARQEHCSAGRDAEPPARTPTLPPCVHSQPRQCAASTKLAPFVGDMVVEEAGMHVCRMCAQPLICEDGVYWAQRKIVNMYALISQQQQQNDGGGGDKTTESLYTYYCKYCGGELGKSADAVQARRITWASGAARELNSDERMLFTFVSSNVRAYARITTIPMSLRSMTALLLDVAKPALF
ncbi:hypothetical protein PI124_g16676, partial [Phytophthora idaei]